MPRDFRGREIKVGDTIVYPGRHGSLLWMNEGVVFGIKSVVLGAGHDSIRVRVTRAPSLRDKDRLVSISVLDNVVVLEDTYS